MKREKGYGNVDKEDVKKRGRRRRQEEGRDGGRKEGRKKEGKKILKNFYSPYKTYLKSSFLF